MIQDMLPNGTLGETAKETAIIGVCGSYGGVWTLFRNGEIVESIKMPYNQSNTPVDNDYVTVTGTKTSDSLTIHKDCDVYTKSSSSTGADAPWSQLVYYATWQAGYVMSNVYSNLGWVYLVFK